MPGPLVFFAIPSYGRLSAQWHMGRQQMSMPLGASSFDQWFLEVGVSIAEKRNQAVQAALDMGARYLFFLGDDTIPPAHAFMSMYQRLQHNPEVKMVTGVYFSRSMPPQPMLWNGHLEGSYYDWHVGEFFPVDWAGCDCLLIDLSALASVPSPWFSQDYVFSADQQAPISLATEDIYFYDKMRAHGVGLWCDSTVQCVHQDRDSLTSFFLPGDWPQWRPSATIPPHDPAYKVLDIDGPLPFPFTHGEIDIERMGKTPDVRTRSDHFSIPRPDQTYDEVWARGILPRYGSAEAPDLIKEWARVLKVHGILRIDVPDAGLAMANILAGPPTMTANDWNALHGGTGGEPFYKSAFTERKLRNLVKYAWGLGAMHVDGEDDAVGCFDLELIDVVAHDGALTLHAIKMRHPKPALIGPEGRFAYTPGVTTMAEVADAIRENSWLETVHTTSCLIDAIIDRSGPGLPY